MNIHVNDGAAQERDKYTEIWSRDEYRNADSPGLTNVDRFMKVMNPRKGSTIIDIGCGSGKSGLQFSLLGLESSYVDITPAGLDPLVDREEFKQAALWEEWSNTESYGKYDYGFCCDVLEHIPPEYTMLVCKNIVTRCEKSWLHICNLPDNFGPGLIGEPLHLTVQPFAWWLLRLSTICRVEDARDLCGTSLFVVSE